MLVHALIRYAAAGKSRASNLTSSTTGRHLQTDLTSTQSTSTMPPRIPTSHIARCCRTSIERSRVTTPLASLFAGLSIQQTPRKSLLSQARHASILSDLRDNRGAYNKRIRKGRGASSGYGKTSGRGHKGQGQHGKVKPWFQGGQTPLIFKHGRMGFVNQYASSADLSSFQRSHANLSCASPAARKILPTYTSPACKPGSTPAASTRGNPSRPGS